MHCIKPPSRAPPPHESHSRASPAHLAIRPALSVRLRRRLARIGAINASHLLPLGDSVARGYYLTVAASGPQQGREIGRASENGGGWSKPLQDRLRARGIALEAHFGLRGHEQVDVTVALPGGRIVDNPGGRADQFLELDLPSPAGRR